MVVMLTVSVLLVVLYVGTAIWVKRRLPESISAMVYDLPRQGQWVWTVWLWASTYTMTPVLFEFTPDELGSVAHGFATSILFTGAMPLVKGERNTAHYVMSISAGVFSQLCVLILDYQWLGMWMLFVFLMGSVYIQPNGWLGRAMKGKGVLVAEFVCWASLVGSLIVKVLERLWIQQ